MAITMSNDGSNAEILEAELRKNRDMAEEILQIIEEKGTPKTGEVENARKILKKAIELDKNSLNALSTSQK